MASSLLKARDVKEQCSIVELAGLRLGLVQMHVGKDKTQNISNALKHIAAAAKNGARVVVLPECFNSPYGVHHFPVYAESAPGGQSSEALQTAAKENGVWLIGGSIPERDSTDNNIYNTSLVYDPKGNLAAKHRKVHLFDIDIPGEITFKESTTLSAGNKLTTFQTEFGKFGLGICYDLRFTEMAKLYAMQGCDILIYPGCFNMSTGPAHWKLLGRATSVQQQMFTVLCSQARDPTADYVAWGHSAVFDPWGSVVAETDEKETILYADLDLGKIKSTRHNIPIGTQRRTDLYDTIDKQK